MSENKVKVYKSGYFPINLEDVPEDKLIELNKNFFEILKRLRKNCRDIGFWKSENWRVLRKPRSKRCAATTYS